MKKVIIAIMVLMVSVFSYAKDIKPYVLGSVETKSISEVKAVLKAKLESNGLNILGEYQPANDANRWLIVVSSDELIKAVSQKGELAAFGSALRIALTKEGSVVNISYTNPEYWANAYFQEGYNDVSNLYNIAHNKIISVMKSMGTYKGKYFGSEEGISIEDVREYQYMFGMPELDDYVVLAKFNSFNEAVNKLEANFRKGVTGLNLVYSVTIPGKNLKLYGVGINGEDGESDFLPIIDVANPKHTAFLPYEILVKNNEVIMLHGRYRIALSFPDLTMTTFSKIMSTPGDIEEALERACK